MNKIYLTPIILSMLLSACTINAQREPSPVEVSSDGSVGVVVDVKDSNATYPTDRIKVEVEVVQESDEKTLYETWEEYAPRKAYDETNTRPSYSDPAYTTSIQPVTKKPSATTKSSAKPTTSTKPSTSSSSNTQNVDETPNGTTTGSTGKNPTSSTNGANGAITNPNNNGNTIVGNNNGMQAPEVLDPFTPITSVVQEPTQEQLDAANALLPPNIILPPPVERPEPLILRQGQRN